VIAVATLLLAVAKLGERGDTLSFGGVACSRSAGLASAPRGQRFSRGWRMSREALDARSEASGAFVEATGATREAIRRFEES